MKHIIKYSGPLNESVGKGSVLFIKGKAEDGGRKLFVTRIDGQAEFKAGTTMFFLSDDFYRVKEQDGEIKTTKVGLNDSALRSVLSIKSPGKISIVKNNSKTPWHWKSLKHTNIRSAISELEDEIKMGDYLLEQMSSDDKARFDELYNYIVNRVAKAAFFGETPDDLVFLDYEVERGLQSAVNAASEPGEIKADWEANFSCIYIGKDLRDALNEFDMDSAFNVSFYFSSTASVNIERDLGDWYNPPSWDTEIVQVDTQLDTESVFLEGTLARANADLEKTYKEVDKLVDNMTDTDVARLVKDNIKIPIHLKKGE